jgi:hypothetical protein
MIANSTTGPIPENVHEFTHGGDPILVVEGVPFMTAMELNGQYVPEADLRASVDDWRSAPVTLNHPRKETGGCLAIRYDDALRAEQRSPNPIFNLDHDCHIHCH